MPAFVDTGLNIVNVEDVALGHLQALEHGRVGERYILGGDNLSLRQLLGEIAALSGRRAPTLGLPRWPLYPLAYCAEAVARINGREPFLTVDGLRMAKNRMFFSSEKAGRELGYRPGPHLPALSAAIDWFRARGYLC
jgi:dihydroflavonol-4-reductase